MGSDNNYLCVMFYLMKIYCRFVFIIFLFQCNEMNQHS